MVSETAREIFMRALKERDAASEEGRKPFTITLTMDERVMIEGYYGLVAGNSGCWPSQIAGVPVQFIEGRDE